MKSIHTLDARDTAPIWAMFRQNLITKLQAYELMVRKGYIKDMASAFVSGLVKSDA